MLLTAGDSMYYSKVRTFTNWGSNVFTVRVIRLLEWETLHTNWDYVYSPTEKRSRTGILTSSPSKKKKKPSPSEFSMSS